MSRSLKAALVAAAVAAGGLVAPVAAHAAATTLYVDNTGTPTCSDTGAGTAAQPFCTVQKAADVVTAGQTVAMNGRFEETVTITRSGTPTAPIVFDGGSSNFTSVVGFSAPAIVVNGAHDVRIQEVQLSAGGSADAVQIKASSRVTVNRVTSGTGPDNVTGAVFHVFGDTSTITISRNLVFQSFGPVVRVDAGSTGAVVFANANANGPTGGIVLDGVTGAAVANNTLVGTCYHGISVTGATTGTTLVNNIVKYVYDADVQYRCQRQSEPAAAIAVAAAAAPGVSAHHNAVEPYFPAAKGYLWAGTTYQTAAAFTAATGQGAHDIDTDAGLYPGGYYPVPVEGAAAVDSGDASAPGVLTTDVYGSPRVDDPLVPNTGAGTPGYVDRGAFELQDSFSTSDVIQSATQAPVGGQVTFTGTFVSSWGLPFTCAYDFGDGQTVTGAPCTTTHAFATTGTYLVKITPSNAAHLSLEWERTVVVVPAGGSLTPTLTPAAAGGTTVYAAVTAGSDPWNIASITYTFGDGTAPFTTTNTNQQHYYAEPGTYTIKATVTDATGAKKSVSKAFTTAGTEFTPVAPTRVAASTSIPAKGSIVVPVAGTGPVPAGAVAAVLNLTAVGPAGAGTLTAWAAGTGKPGTTSLRFTAGQTVSTESFVKLGAGGAVKIFNSADVAVNVTVDAHGYFDRSGSGDRYQDLQVSAHLADTRSGLGTTVGKVQPGTPRLIQVAGAAGVPATGARSVVLNVGATGAAAAGTLTVAASGTPTPTPANLAFPAGRTVSNLVVVPVGADGRIAVTVTGGATDVVVDVDGWFVAGWGNTYVPVTPRRVASTETAGAQPVPAHGQGYFNLTAGFPDAFDNAGAMVGTVSVLNPKSDGGLVLWESASGYPHGDVHQADWSNGIPVTNGVVTPVLNGLNGVADQGVYNDSSKPLHFTFDLTGYFA